MRAPLREHITRLAMTVALLVTVVLGALYGRRAEAEPRSGARLVVTVPIRGMIGPGTVPLVDRAISDAERASAAFVVLDIDTFGGRLDSAVAIRDRLLDSEVRTVAFVNPRAISAGALIALATDRLVMNDGATIGAATPVQLTPGGPSPAVDEKTLSYVRKEFGATAERKGRSAAIAEAMVDADVAIEGVVERGKVLTLTTDEALRLGVADARARELADAVPPTDHDTVELRAVSPTWAERVVGWLTQPLVASVLMSLGVLGIFIEMRTPGFGVPGLVGVLCLALFFGGHFIAKLAGFEELALVVAGVVLITVEVLVIPGFGITGVLGIAALIAGLGLSLFGGGATASAVLASLARVLVSIVVAAVLFVAVLAVLPQTPFARGLVLSTSLGGPDAAVPVVGAYDAPRRGEGLRFPPGTTGTALTPLRPAGTARIGGSHVDVVADGTFVEAGARVEVIATDGGRVVVRHVPDGESPVQPSQDPRRQS